MEETTVNRRSNIDFILIHLLFNPTFLAIEGYGSIALTLPNLQK